MEKGKKMMGRNKEKVTECLMLQMENKMPK